MAAQSSTSAAGSGHRGPGDQQPPPPAAAAAAPAYVDTEAAATQPPYEPDAAQTGGHSPRQPEPPGIPQDQQQMPQWQQSATRKRPATDPPEPATPTMRPPRERGKPQIPHIHLEQNDPDTEHEGESSPLNRETHEDSPVKSVNSHAAKGSDGENVMDKLAEVMVTINRSIELMSRRMDTLEKGKPQAGDSDTPLVAIHHKDVDKPSRYDGKNWVVWSSDFMAFLERRDKRWPKLLKMIDTFSLNPLTKDDRLIMANKLEINSGTLLEDFTNQLYEYLRNYTTGETQSCVVSTGKENSWESWRMMCDHGKSRRKLEVHEEYKKIMNPPQVPLESLQKTIAAWERDLLSYTMNNDHQGLSEETKKLCIEAMCPEALQEHLMDKYEQGSIDSYDSYKQAINTYVYRKLKRGKATGKKGLNALQESSECDSADCGHEDHDHGDPEVQQRIAALKYQAEEINEQLNALVKQHLFGKKGKGKGAKGDKGAGKAGKAGTAATGATAMDVDHSNKDCYGCGEYGHIAANCPRAQEAKGSKGAKGVKGKGKGLPNGSKGKGKQGKGDWYPSLQSWKQMYPGPSPTQWTSWWRPAGGAPSPYKGSANLFEQGNRLSQFQEQQSQDWWGGYAAQPSQTQNVLRSLFQSGNMFKLVEKGPKMQKAEAAPAAVVKNRYAMLERRDEQPDNKPQHVTEAPLEMFIKPESPNRWRKREVKARKTPSPTKTSRDVPGGMGLPAEEAHPPKRRGLGSSSPGSATGTDSMEAIKKSVGSEKCDANLLEFTKKSHGNLIDEMGLKVLGKQGLKVFRENQKMPEKLAPLQHRENTKAPNGWEVISAIVDSGASITAVHPEDGKAYKMQESEASRRGISYATAGQEDLPNLGEKLMAVLTTEGTLRGFKSQCAEVSEPLESVRQLLGAKHCVLFGLGEDEEEHLIINKITGEVNRMRDDGINYFHDLLVVPPDEVDRVQECIESGASPFGGQGNAR